MSAPLLQSPKTSAAGPVDDGVGDLFDYQLVRDCARFVLGAFGRHKLLGMFCLLVVIGAAGVAAVYLPRRYEASTKLLTHQTAFMASLSNPYHGRDDEGPTRAARERVLARDNLEKIVAQIDLISEWQRTRNPLLKLKDRALQAIGGPWSREDWTDIMVGTLSKRLTVATTTDEGTVEIKVVWPDPSMARRIIESAQQNFLETRHVSEVAAISEAIGILEIHASQTQTSIDEALSNLQRVIDERARAIKLTQPTHAQPVVTASTPRSMLRPPEVPAQEILQLKFLLATKQRAISDLEEFRTRQLTELRTALEQQRVIYNQSHPVILELEQRIEALQKDSPQLLTLRRDERQLLDEIDAKTATHEEHPLDPLPSAVVHRPAPQPTTTAMETTLAQIAPELERDPNVTVAQDQLRVALARYQELLMRVEAARLELDTARAAFKYRFSVIDPPLTPRQPTGPNVPFILLAGLLGGICFAFLACAGLDIWRKSVCNTWQIERQLKVPVLATVKL
jgi:uncharacterized protein involved in exopolysaccharide biosynthesis